MKKIILRYFLLFILIFLGVFGLQNIFIGIFNDIDNQTEVILVGISVVLIDFAYYLLVYKRFYPTK